MQRRNLSLLALGSILVFAAHMRWGVGALAWIAPVPWLYYLRVTSGWRSRLALAGAMMVAWTAATAKICTAPLPPAFALLGVAFGLSQLAMFLGADAARRRFGDLAGVIAYPALTVVLEWTQHRFTGLASWAATGYTQVDNLPLLQIASVFGLAGVSFVVALVAAALESRSRRAIAAAAAIALAAHAFGAARLATEQPGAVRAAAIGTTATFGPATKLDAAQRAEIVDTLIADTEAAARAGAKVAVWTEAAALVEPDEEAAFTARVLDAAARARVDIVAAYVIPHGGDRFENKLIWARADGTLALTYWKHHPAPGEPAVVGTAAQTAIDTGAGRWSAAICYDYDFPALAADHGALDVDLVALPSSDWRGIDPIHTQMAALRAIEQGISVVRSTRFGLSAGIDPYGRLRAWSSSFETDQRVLMVDLPRHGVATVYRTIGDVLVYASAAFLLALVGVRSRRLRAILTPDG